MIPCVSVSCFIHPFAVCFLDKEGVFCDAIYLQKTKMTKPPSCRSRNYLLY